MVVVTYSHLNALMVGVTYDEKSYPLVDEVYKDLRKIAPIENWTLRELWLRADRCTIEALGDMEDLLEYGAFDNEAEVENLISWNIISYSSYGC